MSLTTILTEIWRFIKDNFVKILVGALLISILTILGSLFLPNLMGQPADENVEEQLTDLPPDEDTKVSRDFLLNVYEQEPAEFELFVQLEDGNVFANSFIFDEYFTSKGIVEEIEKETGVSYEQTLAHEKNLGLYKNSQYRGSVAGIRNTSTNIITIRIQATESSENNLLLAEAFASRILNSEIPFIQGLNVTMMNEPEIGERLIEESLEMVSSPEALGVLSPVTSENRSIALYGIAGFLIGLFIVTGFLFMVQLFKKKINYAFQYSWDFNDYHFIYSLDSNMNQIEEILVVPEITNQLVINQDSSLIDSLNATHPLIEIDHSLSRYTQIKEVVDEIVILIESKTTDKAWFNEQYRVAEKYGTQITIIHLIQ